MDVTRDDPVLLYPRFTGALSSVVEHYLHTVGVVGSKPTARTTFASSNKPIPGGAGVEIVRVIEGHRDITSRMFKWKILTELLPVCGIAEVNGGARLAKL